MKSVIGDRAVIRWAVALTGLTLTICLALKLTAISLNQPQIFEEDRVRLERHLAGAAHKPFAFRVLVPQTVWLLNRITPAPMARTLEVWGEFGPRQMLPAVLPADAQPLNYYYLALIELIALLGYAAVARRLYLRLFRATRWHRLVPAAFLLLLYPFCTHRVGHIYDYPSLLLMTSLLYAIVCERHGLYLPLFAIACFNKETTVFASVVYACYFAGRMAPRELLRMLAAQIVVFLVSYGGLRLLFCGNEGLGMECWVPQQIEWLRNQDRRFYVRLAGLVLFLTYDWSAKPLFMRRAIWVLVPHLSLFFCGGYPAEWRALFESLPLLSLFFCRNAQLFVELTVDLTGQFAGYVTPAWLLNSVGIRSSAAAAVWADDSVLRFDDATPARNETPAIGAAQRNSAA